MNKRKTYAIVNSETKNIIKYFGKLQYFRLQLTAIIEKRRLQNELGINLEVIRC